MGAENKELDEELEDETLDNEGTEDQTDEDTGADDGKGKDETNKEKTFTQAQVTRMMSKEKKQGKNSVYKELGIDPKDTKMIAMFKAFVNSQKSDEDIAAENKAENKAENDAKLAEAERKALTAELKAEAMMMGVKTQYVEDIVTLAMSKMTDEDADAKVIMGEFKKKYPVWFGKDSDEDDSESTGKKGTGSSISNKDKNNKGEKNKSLGARLAAQRKQQNDSNKSSFWS